MICVCVCVGGGGGAGAGVEMVLIQYCFHNTKHQLKPASLPCIMNHETVADQMTLCAY